MTVIFGVTYDNGAMVGADQQRHHGITLASGGKAKKTVVMTTKAVVAKAGIGPDADYIFDEARKLIGDRDLDAADVADIFEQLAPAVLERARKVHGHLPTTPLHFIVSGITKGEPSIHALQTEIQERTDATGAGQVMALGVRKETNSRAGELVYTAAWKDSGVISLDLNKWAADLMEEEHAAKSYSVDYPMDFALVRLGQAVEERHYPNRPTEAFSVQFIPK
ncbi:hypothetical protein ACKU27_02885 [Sphingobium yanoikuyae]|uniref:hypothetical protein n=1 Tax=Sphingobium yanoikuyae TaxID=13690 RepID=UPI003B8F550A